MKVPLPNEILNGDPGVARSGTAGWVRWQFSGGVFSAARTNERLTLLAPVSAQGLGRGCRTLSPRTPGRGQPTAKQIRACAGAGPRFGPPTRDVRFRYVAVDGGFGQGSRLSPRPGDARWADVHTISGSGWMIPLPIAATKPWASCIIRRTDRPALTVAEWAAQQPVSAWKRILRQGEKGTLKAESTARSGMGMGSQGRNRTPLASAGAPGIGADTAFALCVLQPDASTALSRLARMHGCVAASSSSKPSARPRASLAHGGLSGASLGCLASNTWRWFQVAMLFLLKERLPTAELNALRPGWLGDGYQSGCYDRSQRQIVSSIIHERQDEDGTVGFLPPAGVGNMTK